MTHHNLATAERPWCVLVVEDNPINMKIVEVTLRRSGMQVVPAHTASEGLSLARAIAPDLMMLDLSLPDMSGLDVARALAGWPFPIVAFTAHVMPEDERMAMAAGMSGFVSKPIEVSTLALTLRSIHASWSLRASA